MSRVAVVGAGTMGNGIAHVFAQHGWDVVLIDVSEAALGGGLATIRKNVERLEKKGTISHQLAADTLGRVKTSKSLDAAKDAEIVVEAATENPGVKFKVFGDLGRLTAPSAILASNTSSISITEIAKHTDRPDKVIGMHFMNPVPVMKLVEVIRGQETSSDTVKQTVAIVRDLGKTGIATAAGVDEVMKLGMNHPLGPLALADLIGLDVCLAILKVLQDGIDAHKYRPAPLLEKMVAQGQLGRKSGQGFYAYRD